MKYIVTGGAGFIGSTLVEKLVNNKEKVIVIDNFHTGSADNLKKVMKNITVVKGRINTINKKYLNDCDGIYHLGLPSSSPMYKNNSYLVGETINDFLYLLNNFDGKIVYASSSSVYNQVPLPQSEKATILPTDFYTETRVALERLSDFYHTYFGKQAIGMRLFSVYGYNEQYKFDFANMVSQFIWNVKEKQPLIVYGDGSQSRDFVWVEDVANAFMLAMHSSIKHDVFNVGTGKSYSFNNIIQILELLLHRSIKRKYVANPIGNYVMHTRASTTKAKKDLHFIAKVQLQEGISRLLKYYKMV